MINACLWGAPADALSRLQIERFKKLAPAYMDPMPTAIPSHLLPANWHLYFMVFYLLVYRSIQLPITLPILVRIMKGLDIFCVSQYELFMF